MVSRKYTKDYKVEYTENAKGKLRAVAIYIGNYYRFVINDESLKKHKIKLLVYSVITFISVVSSLCFDSNAAHTIYVSFPHSVSLFPMAFQLIAIYNLFVLKSPFTREQNDKTVNRQKTSALFLMILTAVAFSAQIANWFLNNELMLLPNDIIYTCLLGVATVFSGLSFTLRNHFNTVIDDSIK